MTTTDSNALVVTLLVKNGLGAQRKIQDTLNQWFTEAPYDAPFPPGTLLYYSAPREES
jgi:hypothetical protein